jgi:hypothetical protein
MQRARCLMDRCRRAALLGSPTTGRVESGAVLTESAGQKEGLAAAAVESTDVVCEVVTT